VDSVAKSARAGNENPPLNHNRSPSAGRRSDGRAASRIAIYDGQELRGELEDCGRRRVVAFKIDGAKRVKVGIFPDRRTALRAVVKPGEAFSEVKT
jgi:hypothetical protein